MRTTYCNRAVVAQLSRPDAGAADERIVELRLRASPANTRLGEPVFVGSTECEREVKADRRTAVHVDNGFVSASLEESYPPPALNVNRAAVFAGNALMMSETASGGI
jgi:hypothetical protein